MHQQNLKLQHKNKKGYVLTYDAVIAVFVLIIIISASAHYTTTEDKLSNIQTAAKGSDAINILTTLGAMKNLDKTEIQKTLSLALPKNYNMNIKITTNTGQTITINDTLPSDRFVGAGTIYFIAKDNTKAKAEYQVWQKG